MRVVWIFLLLAQTLVAPFSVVGPLDCLDEPMDFPVTSALGGLLDHAVPRLLPRVFRSIRHPGTPPEVPRPPPGA